MIDLRNDSINPLTIDNLAVANDRTGTLYLLVFESPEDTWDAAWEVAAPMLKRFLITPRPTPVPPEVLSALSEPVIHHRAPRFTEILKDVVAGILSILWHGKEDDGPGPA